VQVTCVTTATSGKYSTVGSYPITDCVKDTTTGLIWEGKPISGWRASNIFYTNYNNTAENQVYVNASAPFIPPTQSQIHAATNSIGYKNAVNASALCGYTNWRLPTLTELQGLVLTGVGSPAIDTTWFPNTQGKWYSSSNSYHTTHNGASAVSPWYVDFYAGNADVSDFLHLYGSYVRLVRSATDPVVVNGTCGTANTVAVLTKPSANLCSTGTASTVTGSGPWNWTCSGSNGGSSASCSAPLAATPTYTLGGSISGLTASGLMLVNGSQTITVAANASSFTFPTKIAAGVNYSVAVELAPSGLTCSVSNGSGTMPTANVSTVQVSCVTTATSGKYSTVGSYPITDCVKDTTTGLIWEGKPTSGFRASSNYYTNFDSTTALQNCSATCVAPTQSQIDASTNSIGYKNAVNASALCGYTDWRLPTKTELLGLVVGTTYPTIDSTWFPNTQDWYRTSTPSTPFDQVAFAWVVNFVDGTTFTYLRYLNGYLRLVR